MFWWVIFNYIPVLFYTSIAGLLVFAANRGVPMTQLFIMLLVGIYLVPPLLARLVLSILGRPQIKQDVHSKGAYAWWIVTQFQVPFMRFSFLEEILRSVPGLYSAWLRLWGAQVGKFVFWAPKVLVADRPFVKIGDGVVFGYGVKMTSHLLVKSRKKQTSSLLFAAVEIGDEAVVGSMSLLAPGAQVPALAMLDANCVLKPNQIFMPQTKEGIYESAEM